MVRGHFTILHRKALVTFAGLGFLLLLAACSGEETSSSPTIQGGQATTRATQTTAASASASKAAATSTAAATGGSSGDNLNVCSLLTKAEVESAIGASVLDPKEEDVSPIFSCSFNDPQTPIFKLVDVSVTTGTNVNAKGIYDELKKNAQDAKDVSGLGDSAYWGGTFKDLHVLKGNYYVTVSVDSKFQDVENLEKALAAKVLARLP